MFLMICLFLFFVALFHLSCSFSSLSLSLSLSLLSLCNFLPFHSIYLLSCCLSFCQSIHLSISPSTSGKFRACHNIYSGPCESARLPCRPMLRQARAGAQASVPMRLAPRPARCRDQANFRNWPWVKIQIVPAVNIPIQTKIDKNGWCTYPKMVPLVLIHSQICKSRSPQIVALVWTLLFPLHTRMLFFSCVLLYFFSSVSSLPLISHVKRCI